MTDGIEYRGPIEYRVSQPLADEELNPLYAAAWPNHSDAAFGHVLARSLAWVAAYERGELVGFVYVAWDGRQHAFLLDTTVHPRVQRRGIGTELVRRATAAAREAGCEWLHVDYDSHLDTFYSGCGFRHTLAGLIHLPDPQP
ncbi:MAG TPA: GNAT family N-acetyltransferase [Longimicrobium sp.]|nr:GNAT family N-acetyltransferase [Longimicrobium sp.]